MHPAHGRERTRRVARMVVAGWLALLTLAVLPLLVQRGCALIRATAGGGLTGREVDRRIRGLWVTRWDYRTEEDIRRVMRDAAELGVSDVFWQVRGQADAYYRSDLEPWGELILRPGRVPPRFDPLGVAVRRARAEGLRIHAWANVMPLWRGADPPLDDAHPFYAHPAWRLRDRDGEAQPLHEGYVIANPVLEPVHEHVGAVFGDIARRYDVDGVHMDYVRFVPDGMGERLYPADAETVALFRAATGRDGVESAEDRAAYRAWIRDRITDLVARIRREVRAADPGIELSAAVWRRPELAREDYLQDAAAWLRAGLIDRALPMIYTDDDDRLTSDLAAWLDASRGEPVTPGLGIYKHGPAQAARQILLASAGDGYCLFAYASLFESANPLQDKSPEAVELRERRRERIRPLVRAGAGRT